MDDRRVLIFPPSRRDGEVTRDLLERADLASYVCYDALILARELHLGVGTVVLTDAALVAPNFDRVLAVLAQQPPWSDLPIVLLCPTGAQSPVVARIVSSFTNVVVLDRPASARTLVSAVQTAIRARLRQYETREQLRALREAEEALIAREKQLHMADRRKDEFLAMLAHELRNPLAPIRNASELLARTLPEEPRMQATVGIVKRQVAHLTRLVDDLLDVSRITQGRIELQCHPVDLKTVVAQAMESVEPLMREKRHKVFVASSDGPVCVNGDSARLVQCVSNILTNSAKYTDRGGEIHIETRKELPNTAVVTITDNGVGIPEELLPQIFQLFVQSDRSLDRSQGGLGIGLSVVQRLVDMHGGQVRARSAGPGKGSTFEIRLPLIEPPRELPAEAPAKHMTPKRVLIVDDNEDAANSMMLLLNHEGHAAESVYSAAEALDRALAGDNPDVILLDIGLPGMDGYEVARRLRARGSKAQLIALTGYGQTEDRHRAEAAGFDAHLVKPVDLQALLQRLAS